MVSVPQSKRSSAFVNSDGGTVRMLEPGLDVPEGTIYEVGVKRTAELWEQQELTGWPLAQLCDHWTFTSRDPSECKRQREEEHRRSAEEFAADVSKHTKRRLSGRSVSHYARCYRRYGYNRNADWSFAEHLAAAQGSEESAAARVEHFDTVRHGINPSAEVVVPTDEQLTEFLAKHPDALDRVIKGSIKTQDNVNNGVSYNPPQPAPEFHGDYQPTPERKKTVAAPAQTGALTKEIVIIMGQLDWDEWRTMIKFLAKRWGCASFSETAVKAVRHVYELETQGEPEVEVAS